MSWTYLGEKIIKRAKKDHKCEHCQCRIPKDTSYRIDTGVMDGGFMKTKSHHECHTKYCEYNKNCDHDEWYPICDCPGFTEFKKQQEARYAL